MSPTIELTVPAWKLALQGLGKVVNKRANLPVLSMIHASRQSDQLELQVTDLDRFLTHCPATENPGADARFLIPFEPLQRAVKDADRDSILRVIPQGDAQVSIESTITGQPVRQQHNSTPLKEWPERPAVTVQVNAVADGFKSALQKALECSSRDESRHVLRGACLDASDKGDYVVGTDGRHLFAANTFQFPQRQSVIVPAHKFLTWKGFADDGEWSLGVQTGKDPNKITHIVLQSPQWNYVTRPIEGTYPNWRNVVPKKKAGTSIVLTEDSVKWCRSTLPKLPVADTSTKSLLFAVEGQQLRIRSNAANGGVDLEVPGTEVSGSEVTVALNREMVLKALKFGFSTLAVNEPLDPVLFTAPGRQMIIMPVRQQAAPAPNGASRRRAGTHPSRNNTPTTQPSSNERKSMTATSSAQPQAAKAATQLPIGKVEDLRNQLREINSDLGEVVHALKDAAKEQRTTEREVNTIRNRLRSLQSVEI